MRGEDQEEEEVEEDEEPAREHYVLRLWHTRTHTSHTWSVTRLLKASCLEMVPGSGRVCRVTDCYCLRVGGWRSHPENSLWSAGCPGYHGDALNSSWPLQLLRTTFWRTSISTFWKQAVRDLTKSHFAGFPFWSTDKGSTSSIFQCEPNRVTPQSGGREESQIESGGRVKWGNGKIDSVFSLRQQVNKHEILSDVLKYVTPFLLLS